MKIYLSENLKNLRAQHEITQEQFAEIFNISPQAVSRWENGLTYPDITILPSIANYYGVSLDELMGMDKIKDYQNIKSIFTQANSYIKSNQFDDAVNLLRDAVKTYPNNDGFLSQLALTLTLKSNEHFDEDIIKEAISLSEKVLQKSTNNKIRSTTTANLCFLYLKVNETEKSKNIAETLPHIWECREVLKPELNDDAEYINELKQSIKKLLTVAFFKIENCQQHQHANPDISLFSGVDFDSNLSVDDIIDKIAVFLKD